MSYTSQPCVIATINDRHFTKKETGSKRKANIGPPPVLILIHLNHLKGISPCRIPLFT